MVKFNTAVAGKLSVTYSNTGSRSDEAQRRFLNINGTNYGDGTMNTESITTSDIAVAVGEVSISGKYGATVEDQILSSSVSTRLSSQPMQITSTP